MIIFEISYIKNPLSINGYSKTQPILIQCVFKLKTFPIFVFNMHKPLLQYSSEPLGIRAPKIVRLRRLCQILCASFARKYTHTLTRTNNLCNIHIHRYSDETIRCPILLGHCIVRVSHVAIADDADMVCRPPTGSIKYHLLGVSLIYEIHSAHLRFRLNEKDAIR